MSKADELMARARQRAKRTREQELVERASAMAYPARTKDVHDPWTHKLSWLCPRSWPGPLVERIKSAVFVHSGTGYTSRHNLVEMAPSGHTLEVNPEMWADCAQRLARDEVIFIVVDYDERGYLIAEAHDTVPGSG